jgi:hypothetical protein
MRPTGLSSPIDQHLMHYTAAAANSRLAVSTRNAEALRASAGFGRCRHSRQAARHAHQWPRAGETISPMELSTRFRSYIKLAVGDRLMNPPDEFLKHAADCEQMAKFTRDPESMATWNRMAERWRRCAEIFTIQNSATRHQMPARPHRHPVPGWAHH